MNAVKKEINSLIFKEFQSAMEKFPLFKSAHEGYAVILEEVQEAEDAMNEIIAALDEFWGGVKSNADFDALTLLLRMVREQAVQLAAEAVQVAAMCDKFYYSSCLPTTKADDVQAETEETRTEK